MNIGEELGQVLGRRQPGAVPRHRRLRAEGVHALGPADARQQVEAEDGCPLGGQRAQGVLGLRRAEEAQQRGALRATPPRPSALGGVDPHHQPGAGERRRGVGGHGGAGLACRRVSLNAASVPAPAWTQTSQPAPTSFLTTSGTRATRRSPGRVSVGTANFTVALSSS